MASIPFDYECDKESAFVRSPNQYQSVGYVTSLSGFGLAAPLATDLQVSVPFNTGAKPAFTGLQYIEPDMQISLHPALGQDLTKPGSPVGSAKVVGVIDKFGWDGAVDGPISLDFYVSQENAHQIMSLRALTLKTTAIKSLGWWIVGYDPQVKVWYERAYPLGGSVTGEIASKESPLLNVDDGPVKVGSSDAMVQKVSLTAVPAADRVYTLQFANSSKIKVVRSWGFVAGTPVAAVPSQP